VISLFFTPRPPLNQTRFQSAKLVLCSRTIFHKRSFRDFDQPLGLRLVDEPIGSEPFDELRVSSRVEKLRAELLKSSRSDRRLSRTVKREILEDLSR